MKSGVIYHLPHRYQKLEMKRMDNVHAIEFDDHAEFKLNVSGFFIFFSYVDLHHKSWYTKARCQEFLDRCYRPCCHILCLYLIGATVLDHKGIASRAAIGEQYLKDLFKQQTDAFHPDQTRMANEQENC